MSRKRQAMRALRRTGAISLALMAISLTPAHAIDIAVTSPAAGAVLTVTPNAISVTTTGPLIDQGNSVVVTDPNGIEMSDGSLVVANTTAVAGMKPLTLSGTYTDTYT
jgi:methionine-rich copper-binding protein CopC